MPSPTQRRRAPGDDAATDAFLAHRSLLFTVAYEILGSGADAEDVLQETWMRWSGVDLTDVRDPRAYLVQIATRQALTRLRTLRRRREAYVGPWLPEPLLTAPDVADDVELAESVSTAMMLVLETLSPTARAVFVLRDVFALEYDEIAAAVGKSPAAVRQIAHRARRDVAARRPPRDAVAPDVRRGVLEAFRRAVETGDLRRLVDTLAPGVVLLGDGGGVVPTARVPVVGIAAVIDVLRRGAGVAELRPAHVNGAPALIARVAGAVDGVVTVRFDGSRIGGLYLVRNPAKLAGLERACALRR